MEQGSDARDKRGHDETQRDSIGSERALGNSLPAMINEPEQVLSAQGAHRMALGRFAIAVASLLAATAQGSAHGPAPLLPTALVEDVKSATAVVEFMDYVGYGQVIKLEPSDVLVL